MDEVESDWNEGPVILDHLLGFALPGDVAQQNHYSLMALARLAQGMFWLNREVLKIEQETRRKAVSEEVLVDPTLDGESMGFLSCAFQWYAVSACNYAQLVGWLKTGTEQNAKAYVNEVIPRLLQYRHKVAAHPALTAPRGDNKADLLASVLTQVVYAHGRFLAGALTLEVKSGEDSIGVTGDYNWSLTLAHERLSKRYWPSGPPEAYQSIPIAAGEKAVLNISWSDLVGDADKGQATSDEQE